MLKKEVIVGEHYAIRHHQDSAHRLSIVRIDSVSQYGGWNATKLSTGRTIRIKSAMKLRYHVVHNGTKWVTVKPST